MEMMRSYEHFCRVRVLTHCVPGDQFRLLPGAPRLRRNCPVTGTALPPRAFFSPQELGALRSKREQWRKDGAHPEMDALRDLKEAPPASLKGSQRLQSHHA